MRRFLGLLVAVAYAGCDCGHPAVKECPAAARPGCCIGGCNGDVGAAAVCDPDAGTWSCPAGSVSEDGCPLPFCAGDQPPTPPCEKQLGVCAGSHQGRRPDGSPDPVCGPLQYGPDYEDRETRCDGLDNDCDGDTDRWWSTVFTYQNPTTYYYPSDVIEIDGGFLYAAEDPNGRPLLKYTDQFFQQTRPDVVITNWDAGQPSVLRFVRTANGIMLNLTPSAPVPQASWLLLDQDGRPLPDADGGERPVQNIALPHEAPQEWSAASSGGTQILHVLANPGARGGDLIAFTQDAQGNVLAGPTVVMTQRFLSRIGTAQPVALGPDEFVIAGYESGVSVFLGDPVFIRVQPISASLSFTGGERVFPAYTQVQPKLVDPVFTTTGPQVPLVYSDYAPEVQIHVIPDALDAGADAGEIWVRFEGQAAPFDVARSARGLELVWRQTSVCWTCPPWPGGILPQLWSVWDESAPDSGANLNPGGAAWQSSDLNAEEVWLRRGRPGTWVAFAPDLKLDGGIDLRAVTWCSP